MTAKNMETHRTSVFAFQDGIKEETKLNNKIVLSKQCCLTCGGNKRIQWLERQDGKQIVKEACLYCVTKHHTYYNEVDH